MKKIFKTILYFSSISFFTVIVFLGGVVVRVTKSDSQKLFPSVSFHLGMNASADIPAPPEEPCPPVGNDDGGGGDDDCG